MNLAGGRYGIIQNGANEPGPLVGDGRFHIQRKNGRIAWLRMLYGTER